MSNKVIWIFASAISHLWRGRGLSASAVRGADRAQGRRACAPSIPLRHYVEGQRPLCLRRCGVLIVCGVAEPAPLQFPPGIMWRGRGLSASAVRGADRARGRRACSKLPGKMIDGSLKWPLIGLFNQTSPHGIIANVGPFLAIVFMTAQLRIPAIALPNRMQVGQLPRGHSLPVRRPFHNVL